MEYSQLIRCSLQHAADSGDPALLRQVFDTIAGSLHRVTSSAGTEALVICAEASLKVGDLKVARSCLDAYFAEARRYAAALVKVDIKDQYMCRALFALGQLVHEQSKGLKGQGLVDCVLESIKHITQGIDLASTNPRYAFLIYNGSVHYWHASRPLQRDQLRSHLLPSQEKICQALDKVEGQSEWQVRNLVNLALAQSACGKPDDAGKTLAKALELANKENLTIKQEVAALQVHLQCQAAKAAATAKPGAGGKGPATAGKGPAVPAGGAAAAAAAAKRKPGEAGAGVLLDEDGALAIVQWVLSATPDAAVAEQQLKDAWSRVDAKPDGPSKAANLKVVARIAWAAAVCGVPALAEKCASRAAASQDVGPRVWADMTRVLLAMRNAELATPSAASNAVVQSHIKAMEQLDDVASSFTRLKDVNGIHCCAKLAWNTGLILLEPELRRHVKRCFTAAAKALESIASPLHRLRTQLHLECAKCEAADDALIKAAKEVNLALSLDYTSSQQERAQYGYERCLDRYLDPLHRVFTLKTGSESGGAEDEAVVQLERAKESKNPAIRADYLQRAIDKLAPLAPALPVAPNYQGAEKESKLVAARTRTGLWAEIVQVAWAGKLEEVVRVAAPFVIIEEWSAEVDKEMTRIKAQVSYREAEACLMALKKLQLEVVPVIRAEGALADVADDGVRLPSSTDDQLQQLAVEAVLTGMQLALTVHEPWLVMNGAIILWNAYLPLLQQQRHAELSSVLGPVLDMVLQLDTKDVDAALIVLLAEASARAAEHVVLLTALKASHTERQATEEADVVDDFEDEEELPELTYRMGLTPWFEPLEKARAAAASLDLPKLVQGPNNAALASYLVSTAEACQRALSKAAAAAEPQGLIQAYARLQQLRGAAVAVPAGAAASMDQTSKVLASIEMLAGAPTPEGAAAVAKMEQDIHGVMQLLSSMPAVNVELWSKLSRAAGAKGCWPQAMECATAALGALPKGAKIEEVVSAADVPEIAPPSWFWLSVAEMQHGQAIVALLNPKTQDPAVQLQIRIKAISHFVTSTRLASFVQKPDLAEKSAKLLWNAASGLLVTPATKCALIAALQEAVAALNATKPGDPQFQLSFNCLLLNCLAAAGKWQAALSHCDIMQRVLPRAVQRPVAGWKAACLAHVGSRVIEEMNRIQADYSQPSIKAFAWQTLAQHCSSRYDQLHARRAAIDILADKPLLKVDHLMEFAEWLYATGADGGGDNAEDMLLAAADILLELDSPEDDDDAPLDDDGKSVKSKTAASILSRRSAASRAGARSTAAASRAAGGSRRGSRAGTITTKRTARKAMGAPAATAGQAHDANNDTPSGLTITHMDKLVRIFILLAQVTPLPADRKDYYLTAQHYAQRMLLTALKSAGAVAADATMTQGASSSEVTVGGTNSKLPPAAAAPPAAKTPATAASARASTPSATGKPKEAVGANKAPAATAATTTPAPAPSNVQSSPSTDPAVVIMPTDALPAQLQAWSSWTPSAEVEARLAADVSTSGLGRANLAVPEMTLAYLDVLVDGLADAGYHVHCLPLCQLMRLLCTVTLHSQEMCQAVTLKLICLLDSLALHSLSAAWLAVAQPAAPLDTAQLKTAEEEMGVTKMVQGMLSAALSRPRSMMSGRLSMLGAARRGSRPTSASTAAAADSSAAGPGSAQAAFMEEAIKSAEPEAVALWSQGGSSNTASEGASLGRVVFVRPLSYHESWIRQAKYLVQRGQYTPAQALLHQALEVVKCSGDTEAQAQCLLLQAQLAALANTPTEALEKLQAAQALGGDVAFWQHSISLYSQVRGGMRDGYRDALHALEGGVQMFAAVARDAKASGDAAETAAASLKLQLVRLLLRHITALQQEHEPLAVLMSLHAQAVSLVKESVTQLMAAGADMKRIEAVLLQVHVMQHNPCPHDLAADDRQALLDYIQLLQAADEDAVRLHAAVSPQLTQPGMSLPVARLLSHVRLKLAKTELALARATAVRAAADKAAHRAGFPAIPGAQLAADAVMRYIDDTTEQPPAARLPYEDTALMHASGAVNLAGGPVDRAAALCVVGETLWLKVQLALPADIHTGPPCLTGSAKPVASVNDVETIAPDSAAEAAVVTVQPTAGSSQSLPAGAADQSSTAVEQTALATTDATQDGLSGVVPSSTHGDANTGDTPPSPPGPEGAADAAYTTGQEPGLLLSRAHEQQRLRELLVGDVGQAYNQAIAAFHGCIATAMPEGYRGLTIIWRAAMALVQCHSLLQPEKAAEYLCLAQSVQSASCLRDVFIAGAPSQHSEVLLWRQMDLIHSAMPAAGSNILHQQAQMTVAEHGVTNHQLQLPAPPLLQPAISQLPLDTRVLLLHHDPAQQQLHLVVLNRPTPTPSPQTDSAAEVAVTTGSKAKDAKTAAQLVAAPADPVSTPSAQSAPLLASMKLSNAELAELLHGFRQYRKWLAKHVLEMTSKVPVPATPSLHQPSPRKKGPGSASGSGGKGSSPGTKGTSSTSGSGKGSSASGDNSKDKAAKAAAAAAAERPWLPEKPVFDVNTNMQWRSLVQEFESLLSPILPLIRDALPAPPAAQATSASAPAVAANNNKPAASKGTAAVSPTPPTQSKHRLLLLLDPGLCPLPWEALGVVAGSCSSVGRCFSVAMLKSLLHHAESASGAPTVDMGRLSYIVDPLHEQSDAAKPAGPYQAPMLPYFKDKVLPVYGKDWQGLMGAPNRVPAEAEYTNLLGGGSAGLLYFGMGRFLSSISTQVVSALNLHGVRLAVLLDHVDNEAASQRRIYQDNRKYPDERQLEEPTQTAMLMLLRGVHCVGVNTATTTSHANAELMAGILKGLCEGGKTAGEAVWAAQQELCFELDCVKAGSMVVYGLPFVAATEGVKGKDSAKGQKNKK